MLKQVIRDIKKYLKIIKFNDTWRKKNKHNDTKVGTIFPMEVVKVGKYTYGKLNVHYYHQKEEKIEIGSFCSIADDVHFFTGGNHNYKNMSTYPFKNKISKNRIQEATSKGKITVDDDVWIGYGSVILSGVHIGQGAVIGAKSIVSKDIPPYAIYVGDRIIKYRFNEKTIEKLLKVNLKELDMKTIENNIEYFYKEVNETNVDDIIERSLKQ